MRKVKAAPHGLDLGPLEPNLDRMLRTEGKRVRLAPPVMVEEAGRLEELAAARDAARRDGFDLTLVGRRSLRSNNSWMHNSKRLMKGADRCTAMLHPEEAARRGLVDGQPVRVASTVGAIEVPLQLSEEMRPGVVSIPHGFGHRREGVGWRTAASHGGASVNDITDPSIVDRLTGNAAYNDVPVRVEAADAYSPPAASAARFAGRVDGAGFQVVGLRGRRALREPFREGFCRASRRPSPRNVRWARISALAGSKTSSLPPPDFGSTERIA